MSEPEVLRTVNGSTNGMGCEFAFAKRRAAHPEVDALAAKKTMTFEEYSNLFKLSPTEPLGSRIDEYAVHYIYSTFGSDKKWEVQQEELDQVAVLIGAKTYETYLMNYVQQPQSQAATPYAYMHYLLAEACAFAWSPHVASGPPYGPKLRHSFLREPRFALPPPPVPTLEAPVLRAATAEDSGDDCAICRMPKEPGETIKVLPCTGHAGHAFHDLCIDGWTQHLGKQQCVFHCFQRIHPDSRPVVPEHKNYNYDFTFRDVGHFTLGESDDED